MNWLCCRIGLIGLLMFLSGGCRRYQGSDQTEKEHPRIRQARERAQQQDLVQAEALLLDALRSDPDLALAHMQLGMLYQSLERPVDAIYHFQRYLDARPDSTKAEILRQVVEDERRRLAAQVQVQALPPESESEVLASLQAKLAETEQRLAETEVLLQQAELRGGTPTGTPPPEWAAERLALLEEIQQLRSGAPAGAGTTPSASGEETVTASTATYTVVRGDTLSSIAQSVYGRASEWTKLYEANRTHIPNKNVLSPGTVLILP